MVAKLDSQDWRDQYDKLRSRFQKLNEQRRPELRNYENITKTALSDLIGEVVPGAKSYFDQAHGLGDVVDQQYAPGVSEYIQSARQYDTPERRQEASGRAISDVMTAGDAARRGALDRLEAYGIDPSVTRSAALDRNARLGTALEAVKQGRDAATGVETRGRAYMSDALQTGAQAGALGIAAGRTGGDLLSSGVNAANSASELWANIYGTPVQNLQNQKDLISSSLSAKNMEVASKQAAKGMSGNPVGQIGSLVGMAGGAALGSFGGPMGMAMGANLGASLGGGLGGAAGGGGTGGGMGMAGNYSGLPTSWNQQPA
jgi:hypothetical protein